MTITKRLFTAALFLLSLIPAVSSAASNLEAYRTEAQAITDGFTARDPAPFNRAISAEDILDTVFDGLFIDPRWEGNFRKGMRKSMLTRLGPRIISQMPQGTYAKLLRVKQDGDNALALVRMDFGDQGNGYIDMHMSRLDDGSVKVIDWYDYSTGQLYSQSLRQIVATMSPTPTLLGKVFDIASDRKNRAEVLTKLINQYKGKQHEKMVRYFLSLDEPYRQSRLLNIIALQAANASNDMQLYQNMLANMARYFSDDDTMVFLLIDHYYLKGDYEQVIASANQLERAFGTEDAGMAGFRSNALTEMGQYGQAIKEAKHAIELEPEYEYSYWSLFNAQIGAKQYANAVSTAKKLEEHYRYDMGPDSLGGNENLAAFLKSKPYLQWQETK